MMNADLKLPVKYLERSIFVKLIDSPKNGVESVRRFNTLKIIQGKGFSDRLHFVARTFYFRLSDGTSQTLRGLHCRF